jgi:hypothetical protein
MNKRLILLKTLAFLVCVTAVSQLKAASQFVSFLPEADAWQLKNLTVGLSQKEHSCVQLQPKISWWILRK